MRKKLSIFIVFAVLNVTCNESVNPSPLFSMTVDNHFIPVDSANKMISSYIESLDSNQVSDSTALYSLIFEIADLRSYLSNSAITNIKIMFAHSLDYINAGNRGVPAGYTAGALTIVIAAYDAAGNYILDNDRIINTGFPCPKACLSNGNASSNLIR